MISSAAQPPAIGPSDIWMDLTVPAPIGPLNVVKMTTGIDLDIVLAQLMRANRYDEGGQRYFPLVLKHNDPGAILHLGTWGAFCVKNYGGTIAVFMPPAFQESFEARTPVAVRGAGRRGNIGLSPAIGYILALAPGATASFQIKLLGTFGIRLSEAQPR